MKVFVEYGLNVDLTEEEQKLFQAKEDEIYYNVSGGHTCGDFANIIITDFDPAIDEDDPILFFEYEYGNDMDKWKEWGTGQFNRKTKEFTFND